MENNEYDEMLNSPRSELEPETEEDRRLLEALKQELPSYKAAHKPVKLTQIGMIILKVLWTVIKFLAIFLGLWFVVPYAIDKEVTLINASAGTVYLYILKYWWCGK